MMTGLPRIILITALISCFFAVVIGAFGAHVLMPLLLENDRLMTFETASSYHFYHSLGLLFVSWLSHFQMSNTLIKVAFFCMLIGTIIFSGSLYILSLTNLTWLGAITPIGGLLLLFAWGILICYAFNLDKT